MAEPRWGLTLPLPMIPLAEHRELVERAEAAGYTDLWTGETNGPDGFTPLALAAAWTERVRLGTGVVGVFTRGPALLAQQAAAIADASGGRLALGIGASSDRIVEGWNGIPFEKPLSKIAATLDFLQPALAGERTANGFKLESAPAEPVPIILAALLGKMLRLAVERTQGAFTNYLPLSGSREEAEPIARFMFASYVTVPVYANFFRWLGYGERIQEMCDAWAAKDRDAAMAAAPWDLIEETFVIGTPDEMHEKLGQFVEGGITLPVLLPITTPGRVGDLIEALAPR